MDLIYAGDKWGRLKDKTRGGWAEWRVALAWAAVMQVIKIG